MKSREMLRTCEKGGIETGNEMGESKEMYAHPSVSIAIHHQNSELSAKQLHDQYSQCKLSHLRVKFREIDTHLEGRMALGAEGERLVMIPTHLPN